MSLIEQFRELVASQTLPERVPSLRDQWIYVAVRVEGHTQSEVAQAYGLAQSRVSQIVQAVEEWREPQLAPPHVDPRADFEARQGLARAEWIYQQALEGYQQSCAPHVTIRRGEGKDGPWEKQTVREQRGNPAFLKIVEQTYRDVCQRRQKRAEKKPREVWLSRASQAIEVLLQLRCQAVREGRVAAGDLPPHQALLRLLDELIGPAQAVEEPGANGYQTDIGNGRDNASGSQECAADGDVNRDAATVYGRS